MFVALDAGLCPGKNRLKRLPQPLGIASLAIRLARFPKKVYKVGSDRPVKGRDLVRDAKEGDDWQLLVWNPRSGNFVEPS